jgi:beta-galactosidase
MIRLGLVLLLLGLAPALASDSPRERTSFDNGWRFTKDEPAGAHDVLTYEKVRTDLLAAAQEWEDAAQDQQPLPTAPANNPGKDVAYVQPGFDDSGWRALNLPHDWGIEGPFQQDYSGDTGKLPYWGVGWYRKKFDLPKTDEGRRVHLQIDGAMSYSMVWINGHFVGGWPYGYTSYQVDLTPYLNFGGPNVVAVRLDNPDKSSRWYPGGGIYRHVWLEKTSPVHVAYHGTYVTTPDVSAEQATVDLKVRVENYDATTAELVMTTAIHELAPDDTRSSTPVATTAPLSITVPNGMRQLVETKITVPKPKLWEIASPSRYVAVTTLTRNGKVVDEYETPFGIRTTRFDPDTGFYLNGQHVEINGTCNHGDLGALGTALNNRAQQRQLEILKEMGCNALRTSHNPPSPELLTFADKMGFLVMDEAFDCWVGGKNGNDYHTRFPGWHHKDLRAMIRRDRNHPSVILWSTGNEIQEQDWGAAGQKISQDLTDTVHSEDPTRPVTAACSYPDAGFNGFQKTLDVFGYNYKYGLYEKVHQANPSEPIFGSETASTISSRGEYFFPPDGDKTNFQVSSYDLTAPGWASPPDPELKAEARSPFVAGQFLWTGFDYLGEPTPYNNDTTNLLNFTDPAQRARMADEMKALGKLHVPSRSSYFGAIDLAGFKKDLFYFMQAAWLPDKPMAHILPHWNWPERVGLVTPVFVYTSGDEAELFLNGQSLGRKKKGDEFRLEWNDLKYEPGELKVVAYKNGQRWAEDVVKTTGPATGLALTPDRATIKSDGQDLSFITVAVTDKDGLTVPRSMNAIDFEISGPGEIVATDSGDATSLVPFQSRQRQAFNGLALVIVRSLAGQTGDIVVKAKSDGLAPAEVTLKSE